MEKEKWVHGLVVQSGLPLASLYAMIEQRLVGSILFRFQLLDWLPLLSEFDNTVHFHHMQHNGGVCFLHQLSQLWCHLPQ